MASGIGVLAWMIGVIFPKIGAVQIILISAMTAVILSAYHIWAQERAKLVVAIGRQTQAEETRAMDVSGRDEFIVLAGQLSQFLNARREDYDSQLGDPMEEIAAQVQDSLESNAFGGPRKRMRKLAAARRSHDNSTLREYGDRFASRVIAASRRLRELGMSNATTARLGKYATTIADIEAVIRELEAASTTLPSIGTTETAEERYWNLRTQAEGPELAMKILRGGNPSPAESKPKPEFDFTYSSANSLFDPPRSDTYRLRLFNRAEATTVDDVRVRVMSIPTDKQWAGVLPVGLRAQHGGEAPFILNGTSPLLIDLLEYSAEKMPQVMTTWSEVIDGQRQTSSRMVQYVLLCTDSRSPQVIIDCGEGKVHDITIEVQGRNIQTCLKTFRVRSLLPNRGADGGT